MNKMAEELLEKDTIEETEEMEDTSLGDIYLSISDTFFKIYNKMKSMAFVAIDDNQFGNQYTSSTDASKLFISNSQVYEMVQNVIKNSKDISIKLVTISPRYDLYVIRLNDIDIKSNPYFKDADAMYLGFDDIIKMEEDESDLTYRLGCVIIGNSTFLDDDQRRHVLEHELAHATMDYLIQILDLDISLDTDENEFLADFLPIQAIYQDNKEDNDYINHFLEYGEKYIKPEIMKKYRESVKKIVIALNQES